MRHRWHYVQPQTRRFMADDDPFQIPRTPSSTTVRISSPGPGSGVGEDSVIGNYYDAEYYSSRRSKSAANTHRS
jgi:hypothetical protein